jgi:hypothetical protein
LLVDVKFKKRKKKAISNKFHLILLIKIFPTTPKAHSNSSENFSEEVIQYSRTFCTTSPNVMKPSPCTPPPQELSKETKNAI